MKKTKDLGILLVSLAVFLVIAGCSHANFSNLGGGGGGNTAPMILTFHDAPPAGITITSFEVTVTGAVLQPGNVSLLSTPQTIELTQLQTSSAFLSTTSVATGSYTSLAITFMSPAFTFLNDSGVQLTVNGKTCAAGASCVVTPTITGASTITLSGTPPFPLVTTSAQTTLLAVDVNLNTIIQSDFSVNFAGSGAVTASAVQSTGAAGTTVGNFTVNGSVTSVGSNTFNLLSSTGQQFTIAVSSTTAFQFQRANCTANNFICLANGQLVDVNMSNLTTTGTLQANEVDFDDAANTQQVTGTIVSFNNNPPTSFQMIMNNAVPSISGFPVGTPVTVSLANNATFVINNGSLPLPVGVTFATSSDLLVGQEVEARVSGAFTSGQSPSFTTDRIALEPTQLNATVASVSPGTSLFVLNQLPFIFVDNPFSSITQIQVQTVAPGATPGTLFLNLSPASLSGLSPGQQVSVGGFLFNTISTTGSPTIVAGTVVGP